MDRTQPGTEPIEKNGRPFNDFKFSLDASCWPGLAKVMEETGELQQAASRIVTTQGDKLYWWDDTDMVKALEDELADTLAAITFLMNHSDVDRLRILDRRRMKLLKYADWCKQSDPARAGGGE